MSYSYDKFLRPITSSDKSIKILDNTNDIKYTIDPFVIINVAVTNNILRISLKSLKVILLDFSTSNEAKISLIRIQEQIDILTNKVPILIDKDIQNYIQSQIEQVGIIIGPTGPTGSTGPQGLTGSTGSADRYFATSSTTFQVPVVGEYVELSTQEDLAYSSAQSIVIYSDLPNLYNSDYEIDGTYFVGQIDYYDSETGDMSLVTTFSSGSGTYSFWYLNLSGMVPDTVTSSVPLDLTNLTTDIIPAVDSLYSLGTSASQWKSLHVSGQTIYIGGVPLSTDGNSLFVNSINLGTTASPLILSANNDTLLLNGTGSIGPTGSDGLQGPMGPVGPTGSQGVQGPIGPTGTDGLEGPIGPTGADGLQGPVGPTGSQGVQGPIGPTGSDGLQGPMGPTGPTGPDGLQGPIGPIGPTGSDGLQGATGATGPQGIQGVTGSNGIITSLNFTQSNANSISGVTTTGTIIVSSTITSTGLPIQLIATGDANPTSTTGQWCQLQLYRNSTAIGKIVQAESSAQNENIPYALNFIDTPGVGTFTYSVRPVTINGTWQFGEVTGNHLTIVELGGVQGLTGPQGTQGIQGVTGSQGTTGATGPQGIQGATGSQGIQGATGPADNTIKRYAYWAPYISTDPSGMGATYIAPNATNDGENGIQLTNTNTGGQNGLINWSSSSIDWTKDFRMSAVVYLSTYPTGTVGDGFVLYAGTTAVVNTVYANSADNGLKFRLFTYDGVAAPHQSGASFWLGTTKSTQGKTGNSAFLGIWARYTVEVCNDRVSNKRMAYAYFQNDINYGGKWPLAAMDVTSWVPTGNNFGFYCSTGAARSSQYISTILFEAL